MHPATHPDIWSDILQYFRLSLAEPLKFSQESVAADRSLSKQTLFSVALTCSSLFNPALDELWRSLTTLEYVTRIYDIPAEPGSSGSAFKYEEGGYWISNVAPDQKETLAPRLQSYLRRIHFLHFKEFPSAREYTLWPILLVLSGSQCHLRPNLKGLSLFLKNVPPTMVYQLSSLISPSIETLDIDHRNEVENEKFAIVLLNLIRGLGTTSLRELTYRGATSPGIFEEARHFHSLCKLNIKNHTKPNPSLLEAPDIERLRYLSHLTCLSLDTRSFSWDAIEVARQWLGSMETLYELGLEGRWDDIHHCIFKRLTFHNIRHLRLCLTSPVGENLFHLVSPTFPALQEFFIRVQWNIRGGSSLRFRVSDIMGLKAHPIKKIALSNIPLLVSSEDIPLLLATWPLLESIILVPDETVKSGFAFDAKFVLVQASRLGTRLKSMLMPFDFTSLTATQTTSLPPSHSPLQQLTLFLFNTVIPRAGRINKNLLLTLSLSFLDWPAST
ncbi:hypothetical protein D9756_008510 [Leucocoprinus leucothites]|uniref:Uncharacterized protein n=1 Tax=Leucocoprinus leucothites TaxID=201217 RepID=A0A8H5D0L6_9AGAR|nr:hypothetical protein D9756_008510 [Leucoagaricus leucothites]